MRRYELLGKKDLEKASVPKSLFSGKRGRGIALVIGGSAGFHGAPVLAALAAMRVGAGYVRIYVPSAVVTPVRKLSPNIIVNALGKGSITCNRSLLNEVRRSGAIAIGMGIGRGTGAAMAARRIIAEGIRSAKPVVVDADALSARKGIGVGKMNGSIIATPHDAEFFALSGIRLRERDLDSRIKSAVAFAKKLGIILVLKGHYSIVTDGQRVRVNRAGSSALATMGTGDVLSGIICGYAATGAGAFEAACAGVYLHSCIGDMLAAGKGNHIIASDVVEAIPSAIKKFDKSY